SSENDPLSNGYASGVNLVAYQYSADGTTWATIGTNTSSPFDSMIWNTTGVADGVYQLRIVVSDVAGNQAASASVPNKLVDNTPPSAVINDPTTAAGFVRGTITLTSSPGTADPGGANASGLASVAYEYSTDGGATWTNTGSTLNT